MAENIKLEKIAYEAMNICLATEGVFSMADSANAIYFESFLVGEYKSKGVNVYYFENKLCFQIFLKIKYNIRIPDLAWNVQKNIKNHFDRDVNVQIGKIDVFVMGVEC